jgi:hypothetical protein
MAALAFNKKAALITSYFLNLQNNVLDHAQNVNRFRTNILD